jgi:hypothetical protein
LQRLGAVLQSHSSNYWAQLPGTIESWNQLKMQNPMTQISSHEQQKYNYVQKLWLTKDATLFITEKKEKNG